MTPRTQAWIGLAGFAVLALFAGTLWWKEVSVASAYNVGYEVGHTTGRGLVLSEVAEGRITPKDASVRFSEMARNATSLPRNPWNSFVATLHAVFMWVFFAVSLLCGVYLIQLASSGKGGNKPHGGDAADSPRPSGNL